MRYRFHIFLTSVIFCLFTVPQMYAQDSIHVITAKKVVPKRSFSDIFTGKFTLAPHYSNEMGIGVAMSYTCAGHFTFVGNMTSEGYLLTGVNGRTFTRNRKWKFSYNVFYNYAPSYYWGTGYEAGNVSENKTRYDLKKFLTNMEMVHYFSPKFSLGPSLGYQWIRWDNFPDSSPRTVVLDYGIVAAFDSRDFATNPTRGIYANFRQRNYSNLSGSTSLQFDFYTGLWRGGILALDLYSIFTYGNIPITLIPAIGGIERMRGYYYGRYRDNNIVSAQLELRQRIWEMIGCAVWIGGANLWGQERDFNIRHTLPDYGLGIRCALTDRMKLRFDYGFGRKGQSAFIFAINEAF